MQSIRTPHTTHNFGAPKDWDEKRDGTCGVLPVCVYRPPAQAHGPKCRFTISKFHGCDCGAEAASRAPTTCQSWWTPSPEELAQLNAGVPIRISIIGGQPPMMIDVTADKL
jgi:hypothetical protein